MIDMVFMTLLYKITTNPFAGCKRLDPMQKAKLWIEKEEDMPGFEIAHFGIKGKTRK